MKIVGDDGSHKVCECLVCGGAEWIAWNDKFEIAHLTCRDCFESYKRGRYKGLALWASLLGKEELGVTPSEIGVAQSKSSVRSVAARCRPGLELTNARPRSP